MRRLSRRQFAGSVGAGLLLAPFINMATRRQAQAAAQAVEADPAVLHDGDVAVAVDADGSRARRITTWSAMTQPLSAVKANVVLVEGMPSGNPNDGHGASDSLTGQGFGYYGQGVIKISVDQFVAKKLVAARDQPPDRVAAAGRQHQRQRRHLAVLRRRERRQPADHRLAAVGVQHRVRRRAARRGRRPSALLTRRKSILDIVTAEMQPRSRRSLGSNEKAKLDAHLDSIRQLENKLDASMPRRAAPA